jgi:nucleotide-binding universal stress UspA family protein
MSTVPLQSGEKPVVVVVGVDGSPDSMAAVRWANDYAAMTGARLRLVSTWVLPTTYSALRAYDQGNSPDAEARAVLDKACAELTIPEERVDTVCREGGAGPVLVAEGGPGAILVVGSRGHSALGSLVLGSVSDHCVHHATCPVVIVR